MPGFIDAHKHINTGPKEKAQMQSLLEAGYTTMLSGGGPGDGNLALRDHIESGMINGPRVIPSERVNLRGTPDEARAAVRAMAAKGIKHTGEIALTPEPGPTPQEIEVLKAVVDEAAKAGVQVNVHAVSTSAMVAAIDAGVRRLVHLPNKDWTSHEAAAKVAIDELDRVGIIGFGAPIIDRESPAPAQVVFPKDDSPRFRDGKAWPEAIAGANRDAEGQGDGHRGGLHHRERPHHLGCERRQGARLLHRSELRGRRGSGARAEVVQRHVLDAGHLPDHGPEHSGIPAHVGSDRDARGWQAGRHHSARRKSARRESDMLKTKVVLKGGKVVVDKRTTGR